MQHIDDYESLEHWMKEMCFRIRNIQESVDRIRRNQLAISPDTLLDVVDLANIVKITPKSVYRWAYNNKVKSVKIGGRRLFYAKDVFEHIYTR